MFRIRRDADGTPDVWLPLKMALFVVAALAAGLGMAFRHDWMITAAIVLLALVVLLRKRRPRD